MDAHRCVALGVQQYRLEDYALAERYLLMAIDLKPSFETAQYYLRIVREASERVRSKRRIEFVPPAAPKRSPTIASSEQEAASTLG
jgi:hypothetical protein